MAPYIPSHTGCVPRPRVAEPTRFAAEAVVLVLVEIFCDVGGIGAGQVVVLVVHSGAPLSAVVAEPGLSGVWGGVWGGVWAENVV